MLTLQWPRTIASVFAVCSLMLALLGMTPPPAAQADISTLSIWAPDLTITNVQVVYEPDPDNPYLWKYYLRVTVKNQGTKGARLCLLQEDIYEHQPWGDHFDGTNYWLIPALLPGASYTKDCWMVGFNTMHIFTADGMKIVPESNEVNNYWFWQGYLY